MEDSSILLRSRCLSFFQWKTVEELENYRAVIAERANGDLVSNDVRDAYKAISFIMLSDFDGCNNANYFDLETLRRRQVLTPDDEAVIDLFRKVDPSVDRKSVV